MRITLEITLQTRGEADSVALLHAAMLSLFYMNNSLQQSLSCQLSPQLSPACSGCCPPCLVASHRPPARFRHAPYTHLSPKYAPFVCGKEGHIGLGRMCVSPPQIELAAKWHQSAARWLRESFRHLIFHKFMFLLLSCCTKHFLVFESNYSCHMTFFFLLLWMPYCRLDCIIMENYVLIFTSILHRTQITIQWIRSSAEKGGHVTLSSGCTLEV